MNLSHEWIASSDIGDRATDTELMLIARRDEIEVVAIVADSALGYEYDEVAVVKLDGLYTTINKLLSIDGEVDTNEPL